MSRMVSRWMTALAVVSSFMSAAAAIGAAAPRTVGFATRHGKSARLADNRAMGPVKPMPPRQIPNRMEEGRASRVSASRTDAVAQRRFGRSQPEALVQFDGASEDDNLAVTGNGIVPPDTEGDVGPSHYLQYINSVATIYDKSGNIVLGPFKGNAFWAGLGGPCEIQNDGDPLARYDRQADRWVVSQFALPNFPDGPFYQCFAVSVTNDPTGEYWQYEFKTSDDYFTDYGKIGVWPDAYYMSFNMFPTAAGDELGGAYAFDRAAMLVGAPAAMIAFDTGAQLGVLPSDLDGATPPPAGSPNYFMTYDVNPARLLQWKFHVDWTTPENSSLTGPTEIPVAEFISPVCDADRGQCIPQLDTAERLEALDNRLMYRLVYRNFGDHESLIVNHTVGTEDGGSGLRWYEIRGPGASNVVYQQGTYAPDSTYRWMGSMAMDGQGNIALGYSKSSASMYPSIAVTGRLAGDPSGTMGAEDVFVAGGGSQVSSFSRWGDYSSMSIDPVDDCTFWYTQEYYAETGSFDFKTRIGAFRFPSCTAGPSGGLEGTVTGDSDPIAGAIITATPTGGLAASTGASTTTTDSSGHYQFLSLPVGAYDVTASAYPFIAETVQGVTISGGQTAVQDFALEEAPFAQVLGTVKDGSGQGWPLYAMIAVTGPAGFPPVTVSTDPVTGYYSVQVAAGYAYNFAITSNVPGYSPGGGALIVPASALDAPNGFVANWTLTAAPSCTAPGYAPGDFTGSPNLLENFDGGVIPPGWSLQTGSGAPWKVFEGPDESCFQFAGNQTGGSGPFAIDFDLCESNGAATNASLVTPPMDFSSTSSPAIRWANDFVDFGGSSLAGVDASLDGGATWRKVWESAVALPGPNSQTADLSFAAGQPNVLVRFHYQAFFAWWWQVDDVEIGRFQCGVVPGGLVTGTVRDANNGAGLIDATVENVTDGGSTGTFRVLGIPGYYALFAEDGGSKTLKASAPFYEDQSKSVTVIPNSTVRLDFSLAAGLLSATPRPLQAFVAPGSTQDLGLNMSNSGTAAGSFRIQEVNAPPIGVPEGPAHFADTADVLAALRRIPVERMTDVNQSDLPPLPKAPKNVPNIANAGNVVTSFPTTDLADARGIVYDTSVDRLWIANPKNDDLFIMGDGFEHQFTPEGTDTGEKIDIQNTGGFWQADGTYNGRTGMLWQLNIGSPPVADNCIFEMDPVTKVVTGNKICGGWMSNQRGLAYDYATDTYYVGGTDEGAIYHVDSGGFVLSARYLGLGITGLAYNPATRHLFVLTEGAAPWNVWVVDPYNLYEILGGFVVTSGGAPVLGFQSLGLEADCSGRLWVNSRDNQTIYAFESGETGWCVNDIPWLSEDPSEGTVPTSSTLPVTVKFDSQGLLPGLRQGSLIFTTDTPIPIAEVPVDFTVLFNDVPQGSFAWNFIYGAAGAGVMPGCAPQGPAFHFCPGDVVTRRSMAGFIERAMHGALTPPPVYLGEFQDVLAGSFNANYIQGLVDDRITAGCSAVPRLYCPDVPVTRAQMAVFVWKALNGSTPPSECLGVFNDVPCSSPYAPYIEGIYHAGITVGCGGGDYCPNNSITNAQMAVFLVKAFGLSYIP